MKLRSKAATGKVAHFLASVLAAVFPVLLSLLGRDQDLSRKLKFFFPQSQCLSASPETQMSYKYHGVHSAACLSKLSSTLAVWPILSPQW